MSQRYTVVDSLFGRRVKALREKRDWLINRLDAEAGVSRRTISRIENVIANETRSCLTANLHRIASALETTLDVLLKGQSSPLDSTSPLPRRSPDEIPDTIGVKSVIGYRRQAISNLHYHESQQKKSIVGLNFVDMSDVFKDRENEIAQLR